MVRVTCLSPTKKLLLLLFHYCSLGTLDLQSSNNNPSTRIKHRVTIQSKQQDITKNNTPKQNKGLKEHTKGYGSLLRLRQHKKCGKRSYG